MKLATTVCLVTALTIAIPRSSALAEDDEDDDAQGYGYAPMVVPVHQQKAPPHRSNAGTPWTTSPDDSIRRKKTAETWQVMGRMMKGVGNQVQKGDGTLKGAIVSPILGELIGGLGTVLESAGADNIEDSHGFLPWQRAATYRMPDDAVVLRLDIDDVSHSFPTGSPSRLLRRLNDEEISSLALGDRSVVDKYVGSARVLLGETVKCKRPVPVTIRAQIVDRRPSPQQAIRTPPGISSVHFVLEPQKTDIQSRER